MIEQGAEWVPESFDVQNQNRLLVAAELRPGELLDELLERADAAWQRDEPIGAVEHRLLAHMHVGCDDDLLRAAQRLLAVLQKLRNNAGDVPAVVEHRSCDSTHQPARAAAVDETHAVDRQNFAEAARGIHESGVGSRAGPAIDANRSNRAHRLDVPLAPGSVKAR